MYLIDEALGRRRGRDQLVPTDEFRGKDVRKQVKVTKLKVTKLKVTKLKVTKLKVTKLKVTKLKVTKLKGDETKR